ncbi:bacteriohopanetetrol glucosamine biosynthesis glycosyltransferase HpnI [Nostoc sp. FACHB-888]|uniref:bacteriohopanetetrol glucosamine biosynthesis glycosyltransferase HpnI n=1 Tax=Nostoc sp. FACHB-888 TaxID=2692842 RepID=UPI00168A3404|nr:bacteriohopanetetrol glucosamine biosynthesis glycosyltransferase HpnI [Nostoc sp. FACHB-888]MBD2242919.1 bacteriohopanetetrol glucosamine biosynthesis glycosyltransferase HpnI [Nostoc sp. FACHB-888]
MQIWDFGSLKTYIYLLLLLLSLSAIWFYAYGIYAAIAFLNHQNPIAPDFHPAITILKPICGLDEQAYENFASFCRQDYPQYQIIFSVRDANDPGIAVVRQIIQDFPELDLQLVISEHTIGNNFKVCNLANAESKAKYSILLLADSDVRVGPDYLRRVIGPMHDPDVGVVTCLYRPLTQGWVANLEGIGISTEYLAGVLVANKLHKIEFALGPTIAIRRTVLEAIGGFPAIADYLADDYQLGYLPAQAGYKVVLSDYVIDHAIGTNSFVDLIQRQIRWLLCTRVSRPWGYLGLIFTYGTFTSLLLLITTGGSIFAWAILVITWMMRLFMGWFVAVKVLNDAVAKKLLWLILIRDLISFVLWYYCWVNNTFEWRGRQLKLTKEGKVMPITTDAAKVMSI